MSEPKDDSFPTRSSLLRRLKDTRDQESWQEFYHIYARLITGFALKAGLTPDEAEEVLQETMIAAAKHLPEFRYDPKVCAFKTWLLNLSAWRVKNQLRRRKSPIAPKTRGIDTEANDTTERTATVERVPDPAGDQLGAIWDNEWRTTLLDAALAQVKARVDSKQWQIFDLSVLQHWSVKDVAKVLG
jgi:RNA polymerase sigma-70 factor (ECF subfamily)